MWVPVVEYMFYDNDGREAAEPLGPSEPSRTPSEFSARGERWVDHPDSSEADLHRDLLWRSVWFALCDPDVHGVEGLRKNLLFSLILSLNTWLTEAVLGDQGGLCYLWIFKSALYQMVIKWFTKDHLASEVEGQKKT